MLALEELRAQVAANKEVVASAVALIRGLKERIENAGQDALALNALKESLEADAAALAAAVAENTVAAHEVPAAPVEPELPIEAPVEAPVEPAPEAPVSE